MGDESGEVIVMEGGSAMTGDSATAERLRIPIPGKNDSAHEAFG